MTPAEWLIYGAIVAVGLGLSAMFSGLETGLYTINRVRLAVRAGHGEGAASRIRGILRNPARMLATLLLANNIANYLCSFGIASLLARGGYSPGEAVVLNAALLIPALFVFGEILPKDLFRTHTDHWTYSCAWLLRTTELVLTWTGLVPIVQQFGIVAGRLIGSDQGGNVPARQRVSRLIREGAGAGVLSEVQTSLADRAMTLRDRRVADEMIPWQDVVTLPHTLGHAEVRALLHRRHFTRYPVIGPAGVVGVVSLLDTLLQPEVPLEALATPTVELEPAMPVRQALGTMRDRQVALAIVTRPDDGQPLGIVTLKDLVEPLTGELASW